MSRIYRAIMQAADHVEREPSKYDFWNNGPPNCGTPGCMIGWIGHFLEIAPVKKPKRVEDQYTELVARQLGHKDLMDALNALSAIGHRVLPYSYDHVKPLDAAKAMRGYAEKYHAPTPVQVPDWNAMAAKQTVSETARSQELA